LQACGYASEEAEERSHRSGHSHGLQGAEYCKRLEWLPKIKPSLFQYAVCELSFVFLRLNATSGYAQN
jgi:hypothetical protein